MHLFCARIPISAGGGRGVCHHLCIYRPPRPLHRAPARRRGVPPVGHRSTLAVYLDRDLMAFDVVYASAGTPNSVFPIAPRELARLTAATVTDLREDA